MDKDEIGERARIVLRDYDGIIPYCEAFYMLSIEYSASRALNAFERYDVSRSLNDTEENQVSAVHEALGHVAAISRYFWPPTSGKEPLKSLGSARAEKLKTAFEIDDASPLKNRELRNSLEHFDERIDLYCLENDAGHFFPSAMIGSADVTDEPTANIFKLVDPEREIFVIMGVKHHFGEIRRELNRVHKLVQSMIDGGGRLKTRE